MQTVELSHMLHLRSNGGPPEVATGSFRSVICTAPAELARYDAQIERLQKTLTNLIFDRANLATYAEGCRSVLSPIRRLPTELLALIFGMCCPIDKYRLSSQITVVQELDRIANKHLLQLSQVSSIWHGVVMGTPQLWSIITVDTRLWPILPVPSKTLLSLLASSLKRSGNHPLRVHISSLNGTPDAGAVLELLSQHARRWREARFWIGSDSIQYLTAAKGNLPTLETLTINGNKLSAMDVFEAAPRLKTVTFQGRLTDIVPKLPWGQLQTFTYWAGSTCMNPSAGLALMHRLATGTTFRYEVDLGRISPEFHWPSVSSVVETLVLKLDFRDSSPASLNSLGGILASLTLPSLRTFWVRQRLVGWNQAGFISLASRSSFHSHLTRLFISVPITEDDLLECLSVLPVLRELRIQDSVSSDPEHPALITDTLLRGLTRNADQSPLVPSLAAISFASVLRFTDSVYLDLITSRLVSEKSDDTKPFGIVLQLLTAGQRELGPEAEKRYAQL
ncbi:hypothetical protein B0H11DRAFT_2344997 [Mycena galericulata]|nr:hypothetical protein B0H11DRAFT_2344997 [Mycena galericulata]